VSSEVSQEKQNTTDRIRRRRSDSAFEKEAELRREGFVTQKEVCELL
jgi:hypothetical protein